MAVQVSHLGYITVNGVDLSSRARNIKLNIGQESIDVSAHGQTKRSFRAGVGMLEVSAEFFNDVAAGSVEATLRPLITPTSTGFSVVVQKLAGSATNQTSTNNPKFTITAIYDGDLNSLDETFGEAAMLSAVFKSYDGTLTVSTSATS